MYSVGQGRGGPLFERDGRNFGHMRTEQLRRRHNLARLTSAIVHAARRTILVWLRFELERACLLPDSVAANHDHFLVVQEPLLQLLLPLSVLKLGIQHAWVRGLAGRRHHRMRCLHCTR